MLSERNLQLETWTRDRLTEMRQVSATEAQLASLRIDHFLSWTRRMASQLGSAMVTLGEWLQSLSSVPAEAKR